jgi:signal transduction histidine kinase
LKWRWLFRPSGTLMMHKIPPEIGHGWHLTTFRWLTIYAVIFASSVVALLGVIQWSVDGTVQEVSDSGMRWQLLYFDSIPADLLPQMILRRLEGEREHANYYGLFTSTGAYIEGDIRALPEEFAIDATGYTVAHLDVTYSDPQQFVHARDRKSSPVMRVMAMLRDDGDIMIVGRDMTDAYAMCRDISRALIGAALVCLILGIAGGLLISLRQLRRVRDIRRATLRIARGDLQQRLPIGGRDELAMLSQLVNHMLEEVERFMHEVKGACDGIAHDLSTPLAHVRTLLGRLESRHAQHGDVESIDMLARARSETDVLLTRFRAILRISEIGTLQRQGGFESVDLHVVLHDLFELYQPFAEDHGVTLTFIAEAVPLIDADRALLFEAFSNLLDNAVKFSSGGIVTLGVSMLRKGPVVTVCDQGPGIRVNERMAVLQRFYRSDATRHLPGAGLGLSIVNAVMHVHDFQMHIGHAYPDKAHPGAAISVECWPHALF